jgi:RNA polymerase sigma factor (sigma-70 family)
MGDNSSGRTLRDVLRKRRATPSDIEDAIQHAHTQLWLAERAGKKVAQPEGFLMRVAVNAIKDHCRRARTRETHQPELEYWEGQKMDADPAQLIESVQVYKHVRETLDQKIGRPARQAYFLFTVGGWPKERIAKLFKIGVRTVERRLRQARDVLSDIPELKP